MEKKHKHGLREIQNGYFSYKGRTLQTTGRHLINYKTIIAYKWENKLYINVKKYSPTTSKIQNALKREAQKHYKSEDIIEYVGGSKPNED